MSFSPLLSILICTMPRRKPGYEQLLQHLGGQLRDGKYRFSDVQILSNDNSAWTVGRKRQHLLEKSAGRFVVFIDDDDWVAHNYIELICDRIASDPNIDCIGMRGHITTNGSNPKQWKISKDCKRWYEENNIYFRTPNHISPVRREISLKAGFPDVSFGEDAAYSAGILPYLNSESFINEDLYHYRFVSNKQP